MSPFTKYSSLFETELDSVDKLIINLSKTHTDLISRLVEYIISSGGKRIRPVLTILCTKLCGYKSGERHINLAAAIEFLHTATLLHDDVVDESDTRRGKKTANLVWGNAASVLVGDFMLSRAFQLMAGDKSIEVLTVLSDASAQITEGEVKQLVSISDINLSVTDYLDIIASKTATLFAAACKVGAIITESNKDKKDALNNFGMNLGVVFQIIDDALDYNSSQKDLGKEIGDDFREGKVTLPVILAYQNANTEEKEFWHNALVKNVGKVDVEEAITLIKKYNSVEESLYYAKKYMAKAKSDLDIFSDSEYKSCLVEMLEFALKRTY